MAVVSKQTIDDFYANKRIAVIGASRQKQKYGHNLLQELLRVGYDAVPVNPNADEIAGRKCYRSVKDVEPAVSAAIVVVPPAEQERTVNECGDAGVKSVWLHEHVMKGISSPDALVAARQKGMTCIAGYCPFMFMPNVSFFPHRMHGGIMKLFGAYPK